MSHDSESHNPEHWIDEHGDAMFRYAIMRVRDAAIAEDMVQDAFVSALAAREAFSGRSSLRTWLIGILRHKILDYLRKRTRAPRIAAWEDPEIEAAPRKERLKVWPGDPARIFEQKEFWNVFEECTKKLPETLADAYYLREIAELTTEQICEELQITPNSLAIRLHRARVALRDCLDRNWFHPK